MRRLHLPALLMLALASSAWAQAPHDSTRDLPAFRTDLERIRADLDSVKSQLAQVLRLLSQRPVQGGGAPSGPVRASVADAPTLGRADASVTPAQLAEHARAVGVDGATFDACLSSGRHAARVDRGLADGAAAGVQGTPGFVIGTTTSGDVVEGMPIRGAQPLERFRQIIDQLLADPRAPSATPSGH